MCCSQCGQENLNSLISLVIWLVDCIDSYPIRSFYPITNSGRIPIQNNTEETGERFPRKTSRIEPLNRSSRRKEAPTWFRAKGMSLLTSAATRFMRSEHLQNPDVNRSHEPNRPRPRNQIGRSRTRTRTRTRRKGWFVDREQWLARATTGSTRQYGKQISQFLLDLVRTHDRVRNLFAQQVAI